MPIYVYEILTPEGSVSGTFEALQSLHEPPFTVHPETGAPVRKSVGAAFFAPIRSEPEPSPRSPVAPRRGCGHGGGCRH